MSTKLVIVESPNKVRSIAAYLGAEFDVEASVGHIRDLAQPSELPPAEKKGPYGKFAVDVEDGFKPYYVVNPDKKKTVTQLRKALKGAEELYLATDDDREGEAIAWHLLQVLKPKVPVRRMTFTEITKEAVTRALASTRDLDIHLVDAQETRRILDRLVGYEVSPVLWRKVRAGLSAGRVQSVATRLVVERERERMAFVSAGYWGVEAEFAALPGAGASSISEDADARRAAVVAAGGDAGNKVLFKDRRDPRITRVGRVLRRTSLDELPQLFNVVRGDMSLVGPRPALPQEVAEYDSEARRRLLVKPGLTGLWQVSGRSDLSWDSTVALDRHYVENRGAQLDVEILANTLKAVVGGRGAY